MRLINAQLAGSHSGMLLNLPAGSKHIPPDQKAAIGEKETEEKEARKKTRQARMSIIQPAASTTHQQQQHRGSVFQQGTAMGRPSSGAVTLGAAGGQFPPLKKSPRDR